MRRLRSFKLKLTARKPQVLTQNSNVASAVANRFYFHTTSRASLIYPLPHVSPSITNRPELNPMHSSTAACPSSSLVDPTLLSRKEEIE